MPALQKSPGRVCPGLFEFDLPSEEEFHGELNLALRVGSSGNDSEVGVPQRVIGSAKYHGITDVKEVTTELQVGAIFYGEQARQRQIQIVPWIRSQAVAPQVAIGSYLGGACGNRNTECVGI